MRIELARPVYGYTEVATDLTRDRTPGLPGWHGLVLFGEGKRPLRLPLLSFEGYRVSVRLLRRDDAPVFSGLSIEDALEAALARRSKA